MKKKNKQTIGMVGVQNKDMDQTWNLCKPQGRFQNFVHRLTFITLQFTLSADNS